MKPELQVGIAEESVTVEEVLVVGVDRRLWADRNRVEPAACFDVDGGAQEVERRPALVERLGGSLGRPQVAVVAGQTAQGAELGEVGADLGHVVDRHADGS